MFKKNQLIHTVQLHFLGVFAIFFFKYSMLFHLFELVKVEIHLSWG